jgi:hypothetical protein
MARRSLVEIFEELPKKVKHADKTTWLREHASPTLFYVLQLAYRDGITWELPEGAPPFKPHKGRKGSAPSDLLRELRHMYLYIKGGEPNLKQLKREVMFGKLLEDMEERDVTALLAIKDKAFDKVYRCPKKVIDEAFPGLLVHPFNIRFIR